MDTILYRATRGLLPYHIDWSTDPEITVLARANLTEESVRIHFEVGSDALHRITKFNFTLTGRPADATSLYNLTDDQILQRLETYMEKLTAADVFSGAVLVAKDGMPVFAKAYGLANQQAKVPNRLDTKFDLASMNKMFTGIAVAQLAAQGKLSFDDNIGKYLPDYPNKKVAREVTIHQLLTHTSGMGDYFNARFEQAKANLRSVKDYFPLFVNDRLSFEPGEKYHYSNAGYVVLGRIIEQLSGQSYFDYVREHIFKLAGMRDTDSYEMDRDTSNRAIGYTNTEPNGRLESISGRDNASMLPVKGGPAGGGFSTARDLVKFADALGTRKLLSPKFTELVLTGKVERDEEGGGKYAYGFAEDRVNGKRIIGYAGGYPGANGAFSIYPDLGYTVVVLSNYDPPSAQRVAYQLREMITHLAVH
jgi:CubicO group peptidase (beta-lactamase class C family)